MGFKVLRDRTIQGQIEARAGDVVYRLIGTDYGLAADDTRASGVEHVSVTLDPLGRCPAFTIPKLDIEALP